MPTQSPEIAQTLRPLIARGWMLQIVTADGEGYHTSPDLQWKVEVTPEGYWAIMRLDDANERAPYPHYHTIEEGDALAELEPMLVSVGAIPWSCPYCGEEGGEPRTKYSRYEYGADADGNRGEMREDAEECCSKCIRGLY